MYSDISIRIIFRSVSNRDSDSVLASSVLPTPVGPRKIKEPIGLFSSFSPALALRMASETAVTASSCPITLLCRISGSFSNFSRSVSTSLLTGMPVQEEMTSAISSSPTSSFSSLASPPSTLSAFCFSSSSFFSSSGKVPYFNCASFSRS